MTGHTPGPWKAKQDDYNDRIWVIMESGAAVARISGIASARKQVAANAHLIAAAPETAAERDRLREQNAAMLEALKALHRDARPVNWDESGINDNETAAWRLLDAALSAAEGIET